MRIFAKTLVLTASFAFIVACGGTVDDADDPAANPTDEPTSSTSEALSPSAPSCVYTITSWPGACLQFNLKVKNNCKTSQYVRMDIVDDPDTGCHHLKPGETKTITSGCWEYGDPVRGWVKCS